MLGIVDPQQTRSVKAQERLHSGSIVVADGAKDACGIPWMHTVSSQLTDCTPIYAKARHGCKFRDDVCPREEAKNAISEYDRNTNGALNFHQSDQLTVWGENNSINNSALPEEGEN